MTPAERSKLKKALKFVKDTQAGDDWMLPEAITIMEGLLK